MSVFVRLTYVAVFVGLTACGDGIPAAPDAHPGTLICQAPNQICGDLCVDTDGDPHHCGGCDLRCKAGEMCVAGACATSCGAGQLVCGEACVDPLTSRTYCGASNDCVGDNDGTACAANERCEDGVCTAVLCSSAADCQDDLFCNGEETCDPTSPGANLFGCAPASAPGCDPLQTCDEATDLCTCPAAFDNDNDGAISSLCGGNDCDDTKVGYAIGDWAHCGGCNAPCGTQEACEAGVCIPARRVFLTSSQQTGDLGGLSGADGICQTRADEAALGGTWKAFLADSSATISARLEHAEVPYVKLDGVRIADNWSDLADESLQAPLSLTETRVTSTYNNLVWTGVVTVTSGSDYNCEDWSTSVSGDCSQTALCGRGGYSHADGEDWDGTFLFGCASDLQLYCIEQ